MLVAIQGFNVGNVFLPGDLASATQTTSLGSKSPLNLALFSLPIQTLVLSCLCGQDSFPSPYTFLVRETNSFGDKLHCYESFLILKLITSYHL